MNLRVIISSMKKILKIVLILAGVLLVFFLAVAGWYWWHMKSEIKKMTPAPTQELVLGSDTVYSIRDSFVNVYLVKMGHHHLLFDAGNDPAVIAAELQKLRIDPASVNAIFLTHTDGDHVAAISLFPKAVLYFSREEEPLTDGRKSRFLWFGTSVPRKDYILLDDGMEIVPGDDTVFCIATPGHSPGSMSYLVNGKYLFTGDALSLKEGKAGEFNPFFSDDLNAMDGSLRKLAGLEGPQYLFTAHYGLTEKYREAMSPWK